MEKKKILFLDCDGVLNYTQWYIDKRARCKEPILDADIDPACVRRIIEICSITNTNIVLSSDWRVSWPGARDRLQRAGFPEGLIIDKTPEHMWTRFLPTGELESVMDFSRGGEIQEWVDAHEDTYDYLIIDDREDFTREQRAFHLIQINPWQGITDRDVENAIELLSR